jgi:hypothetical protein
MALTDEQIRTQLDGLLAERPASQLASMVEEARVARAQAAESTAQGPDWTPLGATAWAALRKYLLNGTAPAINSMQALTNAHIALRADKQAAFWRAIFLLFKACTAERQHAGLSLKDEA